MSFTLTQDDTQSLVRDRRMTAREDYVYEGSTAQTYTTGSEAGLGNPRRVISPDTLIGVAAIQGASLVRTRAFGSTSSLIQTVQQVDSLVRQRTMTGSGVQWSSGVYVRLDLPGIPIQVQDYGDPNQWVVQVLGNGSATFKGALSAGSIDIPSAGVAGFHVNSTGDVGAGGTTATNGNFGATAAGAVTAKTLSVDAKNSSSLPLRVDNTVGLSSANLQEWYWGGGLVGSIGGAGTLRAMSIQAMTSMADSQATILLAPQSGVPELRFGPGGSTAYDVVVAHRVAANIWAAAPSGPGGAVDFYDYVTTATAPSSSGVRVWSASATLKWRSSGGSIYDLSKTLDILTTTGDLVYASGANTPARLAGNTTTAQEFLTQTGTGSASAAPAWFDLFGTANTFTAIQTFSNATSGNVAWNTQTTGDTAARLRSTAAGTLGWGDGTNPIDTTLARPSTDLLRLGNSDSFDFGTSTTNRITLDGTGPFIQYFAITAPSTPAAGYGRVYYSSVDKKLHVIDDAGTNTALGAGGGGTTVATDTIWDLLGDLVYGTGSDTAARLAGNTTTTKKYLSQTGNGTISAAPSWAQIATGDISGYTTLATDTLWAATGDLVYATGNDAAAILSANSTATNKYLRSVSSGAPSWQQIPFSDLSGTIATAQLGGTVTGDLSGTLPSPSVISAAGAFAYLGTISPTQLTGDVNDYNPTGLSGASIIRQDTSSNWNITGLAGGTAGRVMYLINIATGGGVSLILTDSNTGSTTAANRFLTPNGQDVVLGPKGVAKLVYDGTSSRWRVYPQNVLTSSTTPTSVSATASAIGASPTGARADHGHVHATISSGDLHTEYVQESILSAAGDIAYASGASTWTRLASNSAATKKYLQTFSSGNPAWAQVDFADLSGTTNVALLNAANTFTIAPQTITIDAAGHAGIVINLASGQTARAIAVNDSSGVQAFALAGSGADVLISQYATQAQVTGRRAEGTSLLPTATVQDAQMMTYGGRGYGTSFASQDKAQVSMNAAELWSATNQGTYIDFATTKKAGTVRTFYWRMTDDGALRFAEVTAPASPASGFGNVYASSDDSHPHYIDDSGVDNAVVGYPHATDPGNVTVRNGEWMLQWKELKMTGTHEVKCLGTGEVACLDLLPMAGQAGATGKG